MSKRLALLPSFSLSHKHESASSPYPSNAQTGMNAIGRLSAESGIDTNVSVDTDDVSSEKDRLHYSQDCRQVEGRRRRDASQCVCDHRMYAILYSDL
ncbi:hypothetical protein CPB86DRAFT_820963 [Serendipita vermifera]|nr:hypothetical protein CPB86DRAFT_820963 [Serendipita vermifera]